MISRLPATVWLLGLTSFFTDVASEMILSLLPAYLVGTLHAPAIMVGVVDGVADAVAAVLKLATGRLSDRLQRRRPLVLLGYSLSTVARPLVSFATAPWHAVVVRALDRVGKGIRSAPRDALLADALAGFDAQSAARAFGIHRSMDHAGAVVGPLVGSGLLLLGLSMPEVFRAAWIPGGFALLALMFVRERPRAPSPTAAAPPAVPSATTETRSLAIVLPFAVGAAGFAVMPFLLLSARSHGASDELVPLLWLVMHVAMATTAGFGPRPATSRGRAWTIAAALVLAAGAATLAATGSVALDVVAAVGVGAGAGLREPLERARVRESGAPHGRAFGWFHLVTGCFTLPGGLLIGACFDAQAPTLGLFAASALLAVAAAGVVAVDGRRS